MNNFVNFDFLFTKLSGIDPCEKRINIPGGHAWRHAFMACSKLEAIAIYLVKQACGNDKRTKSKKIGRQRWTYLQVLRKSIIVRIGLQKSFEPIVSSVSD